MTKTQEQRITSAAIVIAANLTGSHDQRHKQARIIAIQALEAADRERSAWPTDESVRCLDPEMVGHGASFEERREELKCAMLADPIIKAAIEMAGVLSRRNAAIDGPVPMCAAKVIEAVREAGL